MTISTPTPRRVLGAMLAQEMDFEELANLSTYFSTEFRRISRHNEAARKLGYQGNLTRGQWLQRLRYFNFSCAYCNGQYETLDHVLPLSMGGGTHLANCVPCCDRCNQKKGAVVWLPDTAGGMLS